MTDYLIYFNQGDGWETARQPKRPPVYEKDPTNGLILLPGTDWAILKLGLPGCISSFEVDTNFYKGNLLLYFFQY